MKQPVYYFCFYYPPLARSRSRQIFAHALAENGYPVQVVTIANPHGLFNRYPRDESLPSDPPAVHPERVQTFNWWALGEILARLGILADQHLNWRWAAQRHWPAISQAGPGILFGLYPPLADCLLARWAKAQTGWPLVLDYRDEFLSVVAPQPGRRQQRLLALERDLMMAADLISVASPTIQTRLQARYDLPAERFAVVLNGYNEPVAVPRASSVDGVLRVVYVGAISQHQQPEILCLAHQHLMSHRPDLRTHIQVTFYGPENYYYRHVFQRHLADGLEYGGLLPYNQVNQAILKYDVGFLSLAGEKYDYALPRKLFDYINMERPILAALPPGEARQIIETNELGLVADFDDVETLAQYLARLADEPALRTHYQTQVRMVKATYSLRTQVSYLTQQMETLI